MSTMDWTNDDGSSDEGSVEEQPIARQREPSQDHTDEPFQQQQQLQAPPTRQSRQQNTKVPDRPPYIAFVGNLNYHLSENQVGNFFHEGGCEVKDVQIPMRDGKSRGIALVEFHNKQSLETALTAHDTELEKRRISVSVSEKRGGGKGGGGRGDDRYPRDKGRGDRRNDRGDRDRDRGGHHRDSGRDEGWNRGETRGNRGNNRDQKTTQRGTVSAKTTTASVPATRPKLDLKPRQAPMDTIGERVSNSSIFGEGKPREEVTQTAAASASVIKKVKEMTIDSDKANANETSETGNKSSCATEAAGGGDNKKKDQKTPRDRDNNKKDRNTPRDRDNKKDSRDRKGDARKGNTPKGQGQGLVDAKHPKKGKGGDKEKDTSESAEKARFEAANEKMRKPVVETTQPKSAGGFSALMSDDDDDSDGSN